MHFDEVQVLSECAMLRTQIWETIKQAPSLPQFLSSWLQQGDLICCTAVDDDEKHTLVFFGLKINEEEVAQLYLSRKKVLEAFPRAKAISQFIDEQGSLDERALDRRFDGFEYENELATALGPFESGMALGLSYALDKIGHCDFRMPDDDHLEDIDFEGAGLDPKNIRWCGCMYHDPLTGRGFGENYAMLLQTSG